MSAASPSTWMPTYWGSYAKKTGHFGALLHGAYLMLIKHYWCSGAPLPDDDAQLWRIATCDGVGQWRKMVRPLVAPHFDIRGGFWYHHKVEEELEKARKFIAKQAANGQQGGRPRQNPDETQRRTQKKPNANPDRNLSANPKITTTPTPAPSVSNETDSGTRDFDEWFQAFPKQEAKGRARKAYEEALKKADAATLLIAAKRDAERYRETDPQFIPLAANWLDDERWLDQIPDEAPKTTASDPQASLWDKRVRDFRCDLDAGKARPFWNGFWGPKPDEPGCHADPEILTRHGFGKKAA